MDRTTGGVGYALLATPWCDTATTTTLRSQASADLHRLGEWQVYVPACEAIATQAIWWTYSGDR